MVSVLPSRCERHAHAIRRILDRGHLGCEFDLEAKVGEMIAQDHLGAPLRQTALKLIAAAGAAELLGDDLPLARTQELNATDAHAGVEERLDQAAAFEHLQHRWLKRGTPSLVMWLDPAFDDTWPDAMT